MGHSAGVVKDKFCAQRKDTCKDGNKYRTNCKGYSGTWKYQAHHVLCVASVTQFLAKKRELAPVVRQTKWCINAKDNLLAMPIWGTLTKFYADQFRIGTFKITPGFKNIPVHTYDHNSCEGYKKEVDGKIQDLADGIAKIKDVHKDPSKTLLGRLNSLRNTMMAELKRRGKRGKGTHKEWLSAISGDVSKTWYEPFSMADDGSEEPRTFPVRYNKANQDKIKKLVKNLI